MHTPDPGHSLTIPEPSKENTVAIRVNGTEITAREGTSVYAALTAAGIAVLNESPLGSPNGALCGLGVCYQCRVTINGTPDRRACMARVRDGMEIQTSGRKSRVSNAG